MKKITMYFLFSLILLFFCGCSDQNSQEQKKSSLSKKNHKKNTQNLKYSDLDILNFNVALIEDVNSINKIKYTFKITNKSSFDLIRVGFDPEYLDSSGNIVGEDSRSYDVSLKSGKFCYASSSVDTPGKHDIIDKPVINRYNYSTARPIKNGYNYFKINRFSKTVKLCKEENGLITCDRIIHGD